MRVVLYLLIMAYNVFSNNVDDKADNGMYLK